MTWAKLDDGFWMHPKVLRSGNEIAGIFARCLSYCGAYLTDGLVPEEAALMIAGSKQKLEKLVDAGFAQFTATGAIYIPDYLEHNPNRDQVEHERAQRKERAQKAARKRWDDNGEGKVHRIA